MTSKAVPALDRVAITLSGVCAIHCIVTPLVVVLFPVVSACLSSDQSFHAILLTFVVPSSVVALTLGCRRHRDVAVLALGIVGLGVLVVAAVPGHFDSWERPVTLGATALMIAAHTRNYRLCRSDGCEHT